MVTLAIGEADLVQWLPLGFRSYFDRRPIKPSRINTLTRSPMTPKDTPNTILRERSTSDHFLVLIPLA